MGCCHSKQFKTQNKLAIAESTKAKQHLKKQQHGIQVINTTTGTSSTNNTPASQLNESKKAAAAGVEIVEKNTNDQLMDPQSKSKINSTDNVIKSTAKYINTTNSVDMEGWLLKKGQGRGVLSRRNWKKRYFTLQGNTLKYYGKYSSAHGFSDLKGQLQISNTSILPIRKVDGAKYYFMFDVIQRHPIMRVIHLRASTESEEQLWIDAVSNCP
jgi:hypothetical protein